MDQQKQVIEVIAQGDSVERAMKHAVQVASCTMQADRPATRRLYGRIKSIKHGGRGKSRKVSAKVAFIID